MKYLPYFPQTLIPDYYQSVMLNNFLFQNMESKILKTNLCLVFCPPPSFFNIMTQIAFLASTSSGIELDYVGVAILWGNLMEICPPNEALKQDHV